MLREQPHPGVNRHRILPWDQELVDLTLPNGPFPTTLAIIRFLCQLQLQLLADPLAVSSLKVNAGVCARREAVPARRGPAVYAGVSAERK